MRYIKYLLALIPSLLIIFIIYSIYVAETTYKTTTLTMGGKTFSTEISDKQYLLERGLSYRKSIDENQAMLFVFSRPDKYKFWMKDMNFPIDMIWLSADKKIIHIEKNVSPSSYPTTFGPDEQSLYVIEVKDGTANELGLLVGQSVDFSI